MWYKNTQYGSPLLSHDGGFTLLELMLVIVIASLLVTVAVPMYGSYIQRARVAKAIGDISGLGLEIERFRLRNFDRAPFDLAELGLAPPNDPWGRPYVYLNIIDGKPKISAVRKDGKLNPLNTDYDLFSLGKDGLSVGPLNAKASRDDIVRANNGAFVGLGEDY